MAHGSGCATAVAPVSARCRRVRRTTGPGEARAAARAGVLPGPHAAATRNRRRHAADVVAAPGRRPAHGPRPPGVPDRGRDRLAGLLARPAGPRLDRPAGAGGPAALGLPRPAPPVGRPVVRDDREHGVPRRTDAAGPVRRPARLRLLPRLADRPAS